MTELGLASTHSVTTVVHIISGLGQGGAEAVLYRLATAPVSSLRSIRHVVISMNGLGVFGPRLQAAGIEVQDLQMHGAFGVVRGLWRLRKLIKRIQPDVIQTWMYHADLLGGLVARSAGVKAVAWGIRNSGENLHQSSLSARSIAWLCARLSVYVPEVIVACADNAARRHKHWGYDADKVQVIPNGYDLSKWQPDAQAAAQLRHELGINAQTPLLASVARWNPLKDHPNLLAALAKVKRSHPQMRCLLVGEGLDSNNAELMRLIDLYSLADHLILLGRRDDVPTIMAAADIHVLSSKAEGFPNVVCEAMVSRALCVVTDVGDAVKIVGEEGIAVPARNAEALAVGIDKALGLLQNADLPARLEAGAQRIARLYSLESMVSQYDELWHDMADNAQYQLNTTKATALSAAEHANTPDSAPILLYLVNNPAFFMSHRLPLAQAAQKAGFNVHVATMSGPAVARIRGKGFTHHALPLSRSGKNPFKELRSLWAMYLLLKRLKPQVVHAVTIKPVIYGGIAARMAKVPGFLAAVSGLGYLFTNKQAGFAKKIALKLYKIALSHPHCRVVFQNNSDKEVLQQAGVVRPEQVVIIRGSGVDLQAFSYSHEPVEPPIVALMVARLLKDKGVEEFIAAAQRSQKNNDGITWQIAGSADAGNPASLTREQIMECHQAGVVQWLGEQSDVAALYKKAHIAVLPSYREGLPKSLIEAAACGRAVVTTDVPGCRDAIEANITGLLVPPRDSVALHAAVVELAQDTAKRQRFGRAGRDLAERAFDINTVIDSHLRLYGYLASKR